MTRQACWAQIRYKLIHTRSVLSVLQGKLVGLVGALFLFLTIGDIQAQTDFAPGQIMFTGYNSDEPDGFSIVILADVAATTTIYITDRGWSSTTGFRDDNNGEGTISFQFDNDYPCGTTIVFEDVGGTNDWAAFDSYGVSMGTVTILTSTTESPSQDPDGIEFNVGGAFPFPDGDQLFVYQLPEPSVSDQIGFVTGIHMNGGAWNANNADDYSSQKPSGLADNQVVRFNAEVDNAKYDCSPSTGTATALQAAIENDNGAGGLIADNTNNWQETNTYTDLFPTCNFCCGSTPPAAAPSISSDECDVAQGGEIIINITGTLAGGEVWELYTGGCGEGTPLQTTISDSFIITAPATTGAVTYYVRTSEQVDCEAICATITIGVYENALNLNTCIDCNADFEDCGDCYLPDAFDNPDLDSGCYAIKLIFILDESGSINTPVNYEPDVRNGVLAFLNAINGQDMQVALIEFSDLGRLVNNYTTVNNSYIQSVQFYLDDIVPLNGQTYQPGGGTNWHDAMLKAEALDPADIILFFTDGIPTAWTNNGTTDYCGSGNSTQTPEIVNPVKLANKLKLEDTHMFMLGVGGGIDAVNLQRMSGPINYSPGVNTIGSADYSIGNFADLAEDLEEFVDELCETPLEFYKQTLGAVCDSVQQFMFIIHNPGEESAATIVQVIDTFPTGYSNPIYTGTEPVKICYGPACESQGQPQPENAFIWTTTSLPPGASDTLILSVNVLPGGNHTNIGWAQGSNTGLVSDTVEGTTLNDDLPPIISCPANLTIECSENSLPANTGTATGSDPDGSTPTFTYDDDIVEGSCNGHFTITRTWIATDGCNNTATCIQVIQAEDNTVPEIECAADITIQCGESSLPANTGTTTAEDNCDPAPIVTYDDVTVDASCGYTIQRTWTTEDDCGNSSTCVQVIDVADTVVPLVTCPANITITCTQSTQPSNTGTATSTDNCDMSPAVTFTDVTVSGACPQEYVITRTWKSTDDCGNTATCNQVITIDDNVLPVINCPANITIQCTANTLPANTGSATATDNCNASPLITFSNIITDGTCPQEYIITRIWTASDGCGNSSTCTQIITVDDSTPPVLSCPANITIQCTASTLPGNTGTATATDNCSPTAMVTYADVTVGGACPQEYTITRTWSALDDCGNISTCNQIIFIDDSTVPAISCPANITIQCMSNTLPANTGSATSTDNCDAAPAITYTDVTVSGSCVQEYTINRTWRSTDDCGNTSTCLQSIFIDDSTPPTVNCPADVTIACTAVTLPSNIGFATGTDNCDGAPLVTYTDVITDGICPQEYTITRTWRITDACGNSSTCNQSIVLDDSISPVISCPADITIQCSASTLPVNTGTATSSDNCDASPDITYTDSNINGACPQSYTITRTWKSTDDCGNTSTCNQVITIQDTNPPATSCPTSIVIECTDSTLPSTTGSAGSGDNCDFSVTVTYSDQIINGDCPQEYTIMRTWTGTDDCGNSSSCLQVIGVDDSTSPTLSCPANVTIQCTASTLPANTGSPTTSDNCSPGPTVTYADVTIAGSCPQEYTITRTWISTDACGNSSTCNQIITIEDTTLPDITCPANVTIECIDSSLPANTGQAEADDNCDMAPAVTYTDVTVSGPSPGGYTINRTWRATDACANSSTCMQVITVTNPTDPEITGMEFDTICSGQSVMLTAENQNIGPATYQWMFGSGSSPSSGNGIGPHTVNYTYNPTNGSIGADVVLTVTIDGCASVADTVANVHVNAVPNPAINAPTNSLCYFSTRSFKPVAAEVPGYTYEWNFGPGASIPTITGYGPHLVEWSTPGSVTVSLIVHSNEEGASCADTGSLTFTIVACPGNITGRVKRPNNTGIGGVTIRLYLDNNLNGLPDGPPVRTVTTNSTGGYSITNNVPGQYVVGQTDLPNYYSLYDLDESNDFDTIVPSDPNDNLIPVTLEVSEIDADNVFVDAISPGAINGYVFEDFDSNGDPDATEGIPGVSIKLFADVNQDGVADSGTPVATTLTSSIGFYTFGEVPNGDYVVTETQPTAYNNLEDIDVSNDSDVVPNTNTMNDTIPVTISNGEVDSHNYFKEVSVCSGVVTNLTDDEPGSLRYIIDCVAAGDTISFHPSLANQVIYLTSDRLIIDKNIHVLSTVTPRIRIQSDVSGAFKINAGVTAEFKNLNFTSGLSGHLGAAFENYGSLILWDSEIFKNTFLMPGNYLLYNGGAGIITSKGIILIDSD